MDVMTEHKVVPKLRFRGFTKDLKKNGFTELGKIMIGLTHTPKYIEFGKIFLSSKNISKGYIDFENVKYISEGEYEGITKSAKPKKGDILFTRVGSNLGNPIVLEEDIEFAIFVSLGIFRANSMAINYYMKYWMDTQIFWRQVEQKVAGGAKNNLNTTWLKEFKINTPCLSEQQKIASFLSSVDKKLQQLTKKKELLEEYKKGVMQKIFSQELRFKDEFGNNYADWEEKKLGEELEHKSIRNKSNQVDLVLSVSNKKGFISQQEQFDGHQVASKDVTNYKVVNKGEYAYNPSRINVGSIARLDDFEKGIVSPMYVIFRLKNNLNSIFFDALYSSHRFKYLIKIGCSGSVRDSLNFDEMEKFDIKLPCIEEQQKIANFFSSLDSKIDLVSTQIENTKVFKKGLLQQMFV
jgi:type I restriction enzyme S subunit